MLAGKTRMRLDRLRRAGNIVPAGPVRKLERTAGGYVLPVRYIARFHTHDSLQMMPKYEGAIFDTHRQIRRLVYTPLSGSNLRSHPTEEVSYGNSGASC